MVILKMTLLAPSTMLLMFVTVFLFSHEANPAVVTQRPRFGVNGDYLPETRKQTGGSNCCIIPTCDESGQCYETLSCGYICSRGEHRPATYGATPGYRLKKAYTKNDCHFGECKNYEFLCTHCPDPSQFEFSIYTVRSDCRDCYY